MRRRRRNHTAAFTQWKTQLLDGAVGVFLSPAEKRGTENGPTAKEMQAKLAPTVPDK